MSTLVAAFSFAVMIFMVAKGMDVGFSLFAGAFLLLILSGLGRSEWFSVARNTVLDPSTHQLTTAICLVWLLGTVLRQTGALENIGRTLAKVTGNSKRALALSASVMGLFSVSGGAILSAPLIDELGNHLRLDPAGKTAANIVFRHVWYPIFPIYNCLILASTTTGVPVTELTKLGIPVSLVGFFFGYWILLARHKTSKGSSSGVGGPASSRERLGALLDFFYNMTPVFLAVFLILVPKLGYGPSLSLGVLAGLMRGTRGLPNAPLTVWSRFIAALKGFRWQIALIGPGTVFLRESLELSGAAEALVGQIVASSLPIGPVAVALCFLMAYATGSNLAALALGLAVVLPLLPETKTLPGRVFLLFISTATGYYVSPLHLCLLLSKEYFGAHLFATYRRLLLPVAVMLSTGILVYLTVC